jgi:hypothetical protein
MDDLSHLELLAYVSGAVVFALIALTAIGWPRSAKGVCRRCGALYGAEEVVCRGCDSRAGG